jgi:ribosomal protein S18 acetylase RimI-like enzyme
VQIRRLTVGDDAVVTRLATRTPQTALLADERTFFLVAFEDDEPVGFLLAYELLRRHGLARQFLVYEVETAPEHRRRGVANALFDELERLARERGVGEGWLLTESDNIAANALYASRGGVATEVVEWDFRYADD